MPYVDRKLPGHSHLRHLAKLRKATERAPAPPPLEDDSVFVAALKRKRWLRRKEKLEGYGFENRRDLTQAESAMQAILDELGWRYNTEHPIGNYIVDFYVASRKLAIEVDGGYHATAVQREKDKRRDRFLVRRGLRVVRLTNEQVMRFPRRVKATLLMANAENNPRGICSRVLPSTAESAKSITDAQNRLIAMVRA